MDEYGHLIWLAARDVVIFYDSPCERGWAAAVFCSDAFCHAADSEELRPGEAMGVREIYERYGYDGVMAWVAKRRGQEPFGKFITEGYAAAKSFLGS